MRRLFFVLMSIMCNVSGMIVTKNTQQSIKNAPRNFGTTHFIVGYNEPHNRKREDKKRQRVFNRKQNTLVDKATLIDKNRVSQSFFTTVHDLSPILLQVMGETNKRLYLAAYTLTDDRIVNCIIDAHNNGIDVCVITDAGNMKQAYSKIQRLVNQHVSVLYYKPMLNPQYKKNGLSEPYMHHKVVIVDDAVITGSANFTKAGQRTNIENINILRDKDTIEEHLAEFNRLIQFCVKCLPETAS